MRRTATFAAIAEATGNTASTPLVVEPSQRKSSTGGLSTGMPSPGKQSFARKVRQNRVLLLMLAPAVIYVVIFCYIPMSGLILAFNDYNTRDGIYGSPWVGLANFRFLFISGKLWFLTRNTILYNTAFIIIGMVVEIGTAIMLSEINNKYFKKVFQSFIFLPYFISWVVVAIIFQNIFSYEYGIMNKLLLVLGGRRMNVYDNTGIWPYLLVFIKVWKQTGYGTVIYMAAIVGIDRELYESASIDGANAGQKIRRITIPGLAPIICIMFLLEAGQILHGDFNMFFQLVGNNAKILQKTDILDLFVYRALISTGDIGMASAAGLYQSVLCFGTILVLNLVIKKYQPEYALF